METKSGSGKSLGSNPWTWLFIILGVITAGLITWWLWPTSKPDNTQGSGSGSESSGSGNSNQSSSSSVIDTSSTQRSTQDSNNTQASTMESAKVEVKKEEAAETTCTVQDMSFGSILDKVTSSENGLVDLVNESKNPACKV